MKPPRFHAKEDPVLRRENSVDPVFLILVLALLVLGGQFEFSAVKELRREIIAGALMRNILAPILGIGCAFLFFRNQFSGAHFATFVALFATPVAVSSLPMAQEMGSDAELAGQYVVWTTLISALTIFFASMLLKSAGVF